MKKQKTQQPEITLVGLTARTNNKNEMNPEKSKIGALAGSYWGNQVANDIQQRSKPGITYAVYTDFESAWQEIWTMKENDFDGKRKYIADFEIYDERAIDPNNTVIDIYIGVEK